MRKILLGGTLVLASVMVFAQVGIGTNNPHSSAILDVNVDELPSTGKKGFLGPKVALTSNTDVVTIPDPAVGLVVYNTGTDPSFTMEGYMFFNGAQWVLINSVPATNPEITSLNCSAVTLIPGSFTAGTPYTGIMKVPYDEGNGAPYNGGNPITSTGELTNAGTLIATLQPGTLEYGIGELVFKVTGTPAASTPTGATFPITFGGKSCNATVGKMSMAEVKTVAGMGELYAGTDVRTNGTICDAYVYELNTPDGQYSVRFVKQHGGSGCNTTRLADTDIQIRYNGAGTSTIMWNALYGWDGGNSNAAGNSMSLQSGTWTGDVSNEGRYVWANEDVYYGSAPEHRYYAWTSTDPNEKVSYVTFFMLGAPSSSSTNPVGSKATIKIDQIKAP